VSTVMELSTTAFFGALLGFCIHGLLRALLFRADRSASAALRRELKMWQQVAINPGDMWRRRAQRLF